MWDQIAGLIQKAGKIKESNSYDVIPQYHWLCSDIFKKEITSHEVNINDEAESILSERIESLSQEFDDFKKLRLERDPYLRSLKGDRQSSLLMKLEKLAIDVKEACGIKAPAHFQSFEFDGVDSPKFDKRDYVFCLSDTNPPYLILKKKNPIKAEIGYDGFFVAAIVNCPLGSLDDIRVSKETLGVSSLQDKEVLETIHELRDFYKTPFKLGALQVSTKDEVRDGEEFLVNDYDIKQRLIDYCAGLNNPKSLAITFVAELDNLDSDSRNIAEIFDQIPFTELKEMGIEDFHIDVMSCKTMGIVNKIEDQILICSSGYDIKISTNIYSGYVQNNSSYCYMNNADRERIGKSLYMQDAGAELGTDGCEFRSEEGKQKKDSLVEVRTPGFSILDIVLEDELKEIIVSKSISTISTPERSPSNSIHDSIIPHSEPSTPDNRSSRSSSGDSIAAKKPRVEKKFITPGSHFQQGALFELCSDCRSPEQSIDERNNKPYGHPTNGSAQNVSSSTQTAFKFAH